MFITAPAQDPDPRPAKFVPGERADQGVFDAESAPPAARDFRIGVSGRVL
jgi:hypothetical protein